MSLIDVLKRRKNVIRQESQGLDLATDSIQKYQGRQFSFKGFNRQYSHIDGPQLLKLLQDETNNTTLIYRYTTNVQEYTDIRGHEQLQIVITAKASMMTRYNPLDMTLQIKTEKPA